VLSQQKKGSLTTVGGGQVLSGRALLQKSAKTRRLFNARILAGRRPLYEKD
jgi:ATP-dependent protease HslVU (ClpYQ) peptidase subunit